ncbi:curli production assembly/transport component CsgF [Hymenobacter algoricola]|uniref:Curli production assembly/transport component CsgF n=1 Tax=Hymenobacter algoricola TaxID=486267 RepID=A0ABP7MNP0_9BACT
MTASLLRWTILLTILLLGTRHSMAQDFLYEPKNPSFGGGNTFNYSWMLSSAQAQNSIEDPAAAAKTITGFNQDPLKQFEQSLNQQILGQLSQKLIGDKFGAGGLKEGAYNVGAYQIQVTPNAGGGFSVQITDTSTGNQTTIVVPGF